MGKGKVSLIVAARVRTNNIIIRLLLLPYVASFKTLQI